MIPVDGAYLYSLGQAIQPLHGITKDETLFDVWYRCHQARDSLEIFISNSVYTNAIRIMVEPANALIETLREISNQVSDQNNWETKIGYSLAYQLSKNLQEFESVFKAEFSHGNLFLATPKGAYDLRVLIKNGEALFPLSFNKLIPDAVKDVREGARCLAFELYTASGFHFHRANESVVLKYLAILTNGEAAPERNIEPPREFRRLDCLSQATMADSSSCR